MPTTTPTILDQISAEKTKISVRLARLDTDRAKIATQLTDLETAERVLTRVSRAPPGRKPRPASVAEVKAVRWNRRPNDRVERASADHAPGTLKTRDYDPPYGQCFRQ